MIVERGRQIGFCLACRCRADKGEGSIVQLTQGTADGSTLTQAQFEASKAEADMHWKTRYPEAQILHLDCPESVNPQAFARMEAERRVTIGC